MNVTNLQKPKQSKAAGRTATQLARDFAPQLRGRFVFDPFRGWFHLEDFGHWRHDAEELALRAEINGLLGTAGNRTGAIAQELQPHLPMTDAFDADPEVIGLPDGSAWNLRLSGQSRPGRADEYISRTVGAMPEPDTEPTNWLAVLGHAMPDESARVWFQRWCGYLLTGYTREHKFLFLQGPGGGGKSTILETVRKAVGSYHRGVPEDLFTSAVPMHRQVIARLDGARVITCPELAQGAWRQGTLKSLVSGDVQTANFMRRDSFDFTPIAKMMIGGNHKPRIPEADSGFARRLVLVCIKSVPEDQRDPHLAEKLETELPAIIGWMLKGARAYLADGLGNVPRTWQLDAAEYLAVEDRIQGWVDERLTLDPDAFTPGVDLDKSYRDFTGQKSSQLTKLNEWFQTMADARALDVAVTRRRVQAGGNPVRGVLGVRLAI